MTNPTPPVPPLGPLVVYTTSGCHLCDDALRLLQVAASVPIEVELIDIAESEALVSEFGTRIPVFVWRPDGTTLAWPFDLTTLQQWLAARLG